MAFDRKHEITRGPTSRMLDARRWEVVYRARKRETADQPPGEWKVYRIVLTVPTTQKDLKGEKSRDRRLRAVTQARRDFEIEWLKHTDLGVEKALPTTRDQQTTTVSEKDFEGLKRKSGLITPDHPDWPFN